MSSILTNNSAMSALSTLRNINNNLNDTQGRISTGLKVNSAKDNASYFSISETMKGDSSMYKAINESLTLTKNSIATGRLGADSFKDLATQFVERVAFAQGAEGGLEEVEAELQNLVSQMKTTISQSTFNGSDYVNAAATVNVAGSIDAATGVVTSGTAETSTNTIVTGVSRGSGSLATTTLDVDTVDLSVLAEDFDLIAASFATNAGNATTGAAFLDGALASAETIQSGAIDAATDLGLAEKAIETQQKFLTNLVDNLDSGVGAMVDANMEEEAARLQSLQVQQQLATQSLSIANQAPQNILSLFR
ncbi:flagellin [Palleronia salina]|uniref:Flagellin n=1 Tax=Palleronia salina TaxID=313368 RepID=A0A1M6CZJ1_9RHOB|nr:flagellin [Palleronia salina]SHI66138.1 flagellin [Palleronia salina]